MYSIGMERVATSLAGLVDIPTPEVFLEGFNSKQGALAVRVGGKAWEDVASDVAAEVEIIDRASFPLYVAFDLFLANIDRHEGNVLLDWDPPNRPPGKGEACRSWLIDFGFSGLWHPSKFGAASTTEVDPTTARLTQTYVDLFRSRMPSGFRTALYTCDRRAVVDSLQRITEDDIAAAVHEVPVDYISAEEGELTIRLLVSRLRTTYNLLEEVFPS